MTCRITQVRAWECLDSRGRPTVGCVVEVSGGGHGRVVVPSGASTGGHEAVELRDHDPRRYDGWGVRRAVAQLHDVLAPAVIGLDVGEVDEALEAADADPLLGTVGANAVLAVSLAAQLARADAAGAALWELLGGDEPLLPMPMVNIASGGAHAGRLVDIQDVLVVPVAATSFAEALEMAGRVRRGAAAVLAERGGDAALVADEGGLAFAAASNEEALALVVEGIVRAGLAPGREVALAIDIAANQLWDGAGYRLDVEDRTLTAGELVDLFVGWCERYPIVSLEDVLHEDDWAGWRTASQRLGVGRQLLGDDLFATNAGRLADGIRQGVGNAVLVKPNQAGTFSRAARVASDAAAAGTHGWSARGPATRRTAVGRPRRGWRAGQIKVGSTMRSERTAKWNRLLEIEALAGSRAGFAGAAALGGFASG